MKYPLLFSPLNIGNCSIKNRIVFSPLCMNFGTFDGTPTDALINHYATRAKGGAGLIVTEITRINDMTGASTFNQLSVSRDYNIVPLKKLVSAIHEHDTKIFVQLHHPGRQNIGLMVGFVSPSILLNKTGKWYGKFLFKISPTIGKFLVNKKITLRTVAPSKTAPSAIVNSRIRALSKRQIKKIIEQFVDGAERCKKAGVDGVYLHAAHGYLIQQFLSPYTNKRTDEYGGSFENRMRFLLEIVNGIKTRCPDYPVVVRLAVDECYQKIGISDGYTISEGTKMAKMLENIGTDAIDVSLASYDTCNYWLEPASFEGGWRTPYIKAIKDAVTIPVIAVNILRTPEDAEKQLTDNISDFASFGRPLLSDPYFAKKASNGEEKSIKRCISCLYCFESMMKNAFHGKHGHCAVNPQLGQENIELKKDGDNSRVVIVGAGIAGLTAAEVLAKRGFSVTVFEKNANPGGQVAAAASQKLKERLGWCIEDTEFAATSHGAKILYNTPATLDLIQKADPYAIIIAAGATPIIPDDLEGIDLPFVHTALDVFLDKVDIVDKNVTVIGSGMTGLEAAYLLAKKGNKVTIADISDTPAKGTWVQHVDDALTHFNGLDVDFKLNHELSCIAQNLVKLKNIKSGEFVEIAADAVILALGVKPENALYSELKCTLDPTAAQQSCDSADNTEKQLPKIFIIGDAKIPGRIAHATRAAFELASKL